jgi:hypothetical protein
MEDTMTLQRIYYVAVIVASIAASCVAIATLLQMLG